MPRYVVPDTSALAAGLYKESYSMNAIPLIAALKSGDADAIAPSLGHAEFLNASRKKIAGFAGPALPEEFVDEVVDEFLSLPIKWQDIASFSPKVWNSHRKERIQTGDAYFLEIARLWDAELWTADHGFAIDASRVYPRVFDLTLRPFA